MAVGQLLQLPRQRILDGEVQAVPGALLYGYQAGTSNPIILYTDSALTVPSQNPAPADSTGLFQALYVDPSVSSYKLRVTTADGVELWTVDNIPAVSPQASVQDTSTFRLIASSQIFTYDADGNPDPGGQSITFSLVRQNITETAQWSTTPSVTLGGAGDNRTLSIADFGANDSVKVRATITVGTTSYYDEITVHRLTAGSDAITGFLTNEAHVLSTDASGVVDSYDTANGFFKVYKGATDVTASAAFTVESETSVSGTINDIDNSPVNGQVRGFYRVTSLTANNGTLAMRASYGGVNIDKVFSISKSVKGATGDTGPTGPSGDPAKVIRIVATGQVFTFDNSGTADPPGQSITLESIRTNITTSTSWVTDPVVTLGGSGDTRTLAIADFGSNDSVEITASAEGYSDKITIVRVQDGLNGGIDGLVGFLTNEAHIVPATSDGTVTSWTGAGGTFKVYQGITDVTTSCSFAVQSSSNLTAGINASTGVYSATAMAADVGTVTFRATFSGTDIDKVFTVTKSKAGADGAPGAPGADGADGAPGQRGPGEFSVAVGQSGSGYSISSADASLWNGGTITNGLAAEAAARIIATSSNGYIEQRDILTIYEPGVQAATRIYTGPRTTSYGAVVASQWSSKVTQTIDGSLIVNGTISADKIVVGSITGQYLSDFTITGVKIANSTITSTQIQATSISSDRLIPSTFSLAANGVGLDFVNSRLTFNDGTRMRVTGTGFGASGQFTDWFGPSGTVGSVTETGALWYIKKDGTAFFNGNVGGDIINGEILKQYRPVAWGKYSQTNDNVHVSHIMYNCTVTNISSGSPGRTKVVFNTVRPSANYIVVANGAENVGTDDTLPNAVICMPYRHQTGYFMIGTRNASGSARNADYVSFIVFAAD